MNFADYLKTGISYWPNWFNLLLLRCNVFGKYMYGRKYLNAIKHIDEVKTDKKLLEMVNYAIENVKYYRDRYHGLKLKSIAEFEEKIRFIDKNEVMAHWDEFLVDNIDWSKCIIGTTGGTSGKPLKLVIPKNRYIHSLAFWHKELKWYGWNYDTRAVIRNHKLKKGRNYMVNPVLKEFIFDAFRMDTDYAKTVWHIMRKHHIKYIHAYPSGAYQFLKYCTSQKLDISFIKLCILTSEGVTNEQRHFIEEELHIPIYISYGHSEKLIMAGSCPNSQYYHIEPCYGYCELIDINGNIIKETNKQGELVGTTYTNKYFPLIRYRTGDFSSYTNNICTKHTKKYKLLNNILGHWDKSIIYRNDGGYTSLAALNLHSDIYEHIDGLQYIQEKKGELIILLIPNEKYTDMDTLFFKNHFKNALGDSAKIELKFVNKLIIQPNGKFLPLISKISD